MRLFIELKTTPYEKELFEIVEGYKKSIAGVKWVESENLHITLKFLGEADEEMLLKVKDMLGPFAEKLQKFDFSIGGISGFPYEKNARVLFFKVQDGFDKISKIMESLSSVLLRFGFEEEKSYTPHITFARAKVTPINLEKVQRSTFEILSNALGMLIMKSNLAKDTPIYSVLYEFDFLGK
jgi:2'-5' RNA ligase